MDDRVDEQHLEDDRRNLGTPDCSPAARLNIVEVAERERERVAEHAAQWAAEVASKTTPVETKAAIVLTNDDWAT